MKLLKKTPNANKLKASTKGCSPEQPFLFGNFLSMPIGKVHAQNIFENTSTYLLVNGCCKPLWAAIRYHYPRN